MVRILVGPIPEPDDLFGRASEIAECERALISSNVLLLAPRRFGKSGVMRHLLRHPPNGLTPVWLHLEDVQDGPQFATRLVLAVRSDTKFAKLWRHANKLVASFSERIEEVGAAELASLKLRPAAEKNWTELVTEIVTTLEKLDLPTLFLWDELPAMLKTIAETQSNEKAREFLSWFRSLRLDGNENLGCHRFVVAGSTGLDYLLNSAPWKSRVHQRLQARGNRTSLIAG